MTREMAEKIIKSDDYYKQLSNLSYPDVCNVMIVKYGRCKGNYYLDVECNIPNKTIKRSREGLDIHHYFEKEAIFLSDSKQAKIYAKEHPEYQEAKYLVYCNLLEHLILHIRIYHEYGSDERKLKFGLGGIIKNKQKINRLFDENANDEIYNRYEIIDFNVIKNNLNDYLDILLNDVSLVQKEKSMRKEKLFWILSCTNCSLGIEMKESIFILDKLKKRYKLLNKKLKK